LSTQLARSHQHRSRTILKIVEGSKIRAPHTTPHTPRIDHRNQKSIVVATINATAPPLQSRISPQTNAATWPKPSSIDTSNAISPKNITAAPRRPAPRPTLQLPALFASGCSSRARINGPPAPAPHFNGRRAWIRRGPRARGGPGAPGTTFFRFETVAETFTSRNGEIAVSPTPIGLLHVYRAVAVVSAVFATTPTEQH